MLILYIPSFFSLPIGPLAATVSGPHRTVAGITQLQKAVGFREPLYQTGRVCSGKICCDKCHSKPEIMLVAGALSVCNLFIKSVGFFLFFCFFVERLK